MNSVAAMVLSVLFFVTFFASTFSAVSPALSFSDELLVVVAFGLAILGGRFRKEYSRILVALIVFWVYDISASALSPYFRGFGLTLLDVFLFSKPILLYIGMMSLPLSVIQRFSRRIMPLAYLYLFSAFVMYFVNLLVPIFPVSDQRFGLDSYPFIASNAGEFANHVFVSGILIYSIGGSRRLRNISVGIMTFLSFASLRFKAMVLALIYVLLIFARRLGLMSSRDIETSSGMLTTVNRIRVIYLLAIVPFGLALGAGQFSHYYLGELTPRLFLMQSAVEVAREFFPFGAGGGVFGSAVSKLQYSELYYDLGFSGRWGLTETDGRFLSDNFWPMVIAQYGILGLGIFLTIYTMIARSLLRHWASNYRLSIGVVAILLNLATSTIGSAILIGNLGVVLIAALVLLLRDG